MPVHLDPITAVGVVMLLALTAYTLLGGADFGGGVWDLLASGPRRNLQREAISEAIGPVWEANHVWLIFLVVMLFTAFPRAFSVMSVAFFGLFHLVLVGIILRGAAFAFRASTEAGSRRWKNWSTVFGIASVVTPVLLGIALGALSSGGILVTPAGVSVAPLLAWFSPFSLIMGGLALAAFSYLAAVFLTVETRGLVQEDFRIRALGSGVAVILLAGLVLPAAQRYAPLIVAHLARPSSALPMATGALLALATAWALWAHRYRLARVTAVLQIVIVLWGWAFAQWPYLVYPDLTVHNSAAPAPVFQFLLSALPFGFALLIPSLVLLYLVFKGRPQQPREL